MGDGRGLHVRAGNAMARTRDGLLDGALEALVRHGARRTTMAEIAALGGVAKATLYNHFRTKGEVWAALALREVEAAGAALVGAAAGDLGAALADAATAVGQHPGVRRLAAAEPELLVRLAGDEGSAAWGRAQDAVRAALTAAGRSDGMVPTDLVLRWLASHLTRPADAVMCRAEADLLAPALTPHSP